MTSDQRMLWWFSLGTLYLVQIIIFLVVVLKKLDIIIIGNILLIFQISTSVVILIIALAISLAVGSYTLDHVDQIKEEIMSKISMLRVVVSSLVFKLSSGFLKILTGILVFLAQEATNYSVFHKITITLFVTVYIYFCTELISRQNRRDQIMGVFFYLVPVVVGVVTFAKVIGGDQLRAWWISVRGSERILVTCAVMSLALAFVFSLVRESSRSADSHITSARSGRDTA
jgi:hypothetical protein